MESEGEALGRVPSRRFNQTVRRCDGDVIGNWKRKDCACIILRLGKPEYMSVLLLSRTFFLLSFSFYIRIAKWIYIQEKTVA